jgi:DNA helicase-2/ATP-dependent DNA helicase PcrA
MAERLAMLGVGRSMTICTFHSLCARLLRIHHERADGLPPDFTIFDTADQRKVIKEAVVRAELSTDQWSPAKVQGVISHAKNAMLTAAAYADQAYDWGSRAISQIYSEYEQVLAEQHGLDFDDLLLKLAMVLQADGDLRRQIEDRYTHVLIDEYQDTNSAQYNIAHLITEQRHNLCATGDPDQSIYGWRGADIRNILRFEEDHPDATVVRLEQNYRSSKRILAAASALIEHNTQRKDKTLWTENPEGRAVRVVSLDDAEEEAQFIAEEASRYQLKRRQPLRYGGFLPHQRTQPCRGRSADQVRRTLSSRTRHRVLQPQGNQGCPRLHPGHDQPARRGLAPARHQHAHARHRPNHD